MSSLAPKKTSSSTIGLFTFIGMTCALVASVRNIPDLAATGWNMFFFMGIATFFFALPISLMAAEYAGMYQKDGGPELWISNGISEKWGFVTSWLLWVQMFPGMVMVASALAPLLAITINRPDLAGSNIFTLSCILVVYWIISILNMYFDMAKIGGKIGSWFGVYIPVVILMALGGFATLKTGIRTNSVFGDFTFSKLIPDSLSSAADLSYLAAICFIFTGIEMSSVYFTRLNKNKISTYVKGISFALIFMFSFNLLNAFFLANSVSSGNLELNNIAQGPVIWLHILGLPSWIANVFAACVFIGVTVQLSAWASGPAKTIQASAKKGLYPPSFGFWRENTHGVSRSVILVQAIVISLFALVYLLIPAVNSAFLLLVTATSVIYCVVYVLMAIGILRLRLTLPDMPRPFHIGRPNSNTLIFILSFILLFTILTTIILTLASSSIIDAIIVVSITLLFTLIPLYLHSIRNIAWKQRIDSMLDTQE